jgi:hypothetical protein
VIRCRLGTRCRLKDAVWQGTRNRLRRPSSKTSPVFRHFGGFAILYEQSWIHRNNQCFEGILIVQIFSNASNLCHYYATDYCPARNARSDYTVATPNTLLICLSSFSLSCLSIVTPGCLRCNFVALPQKFLDMFGSSKGSCSSAGSAKGSSSEAAAVPVSA